LPYPPYHPDRADLPLVLDRDEFAREFPGESEFVEFKTGLGGKTIQETAVAFSNADGGVILIGVRDDGTIAGRKLDPGTEDAIHQAFRQIHNPGRYSIHAVTVAEKAIVVIAIARRVEGFAQQSNGSVRVRKGTRDEAAIGADLQEIANRRSSARFELTPTAITADDADPDLLKRLGEEFAWSGKDTSSRLEENGYLRGGHLTVAGALFLTPQPTEELGKAFVEVLRYRDDDSVDYDLRLAFDGPIASQLVETVDRVLELLGTQIVVLGPRRYELSPIPPVVLREAVANAIAHRSYELNRSPVRIELRPSAVSISSPGGLPEPVTVENIREASSPRNMAVIKGLRRFGLAEDAGRGIDVMEDTMADQLLSPPEFHDQGHVVKVVLPLRSAVAPEERAWIFDLEQAGTLTGTDRVILVHAARGEVLTNAKVRDLVRVGSEEAREALQRLRDSGMLVQEGKRGGATYTITESLSPPAGLRLSRPDLLRLVEGLANDGPVTNRLVRAATGLDRLEVRGLLAELASSGRLIQLGSKRGTKYVLPAEG